MKCNQAKEERQQYLKKARKYAETNEVVLEVYLQFAESVDMSHCYTRKKFLQRLKNKDEFKKYQ